MRSTLVVMLSVLAGAWGVGGGTTQQPSPAATLTALDYAEIYNLYGAYSRWLDFGESDPTALKGISGIYAPDGKFVLVAPAVPDKPCAIGRLPAYWKLESLDLVRGLVAE